MTDRKSQADLDADPKSKQQVEFTHRVSDWLARAGVTNEEARSTLSVGLVDSIAAVTAAQQELEHLLELNPEDADQADKALQHAANIHVQLLNEVRWYLEDMKPLWESQFEAKLAELGPVDDND